MSDFPQVFTFYSFKGGVGRSMAVLNVAYALAGRGRNVLVLDMDLEAPGLSGFLRRHQEVGEFARYDVIDLVQWAAQISAARNSGEKLDRSALPPLSDYVVGVLSEKLAPLMPSRGELGRVDIIPVDDRDERDYYGRLTALGIGSFNHEALRQIGSVLNVWLKSREFAVEVPGYYGSAGERTGKYDYVLVDSRTGVTEIGGLCIGPLSDHLVVFTGLNDQNIAGTSHFLREVGVRADGHPGPAAPDEGESRSQGLDPKPTMIVATPVPSGELDTKKERLEELRRMVGAVVCQLSYHPQLALMETIFVRDYAREYLALEYNELVDRLMRQAKDGTDFDPMQLMMKSGTSLDERQRDLINKAIRNSSIAGNHVALDFVLSRIRFDAVRDDIDVVLLDRIHRILSGHKDDRDYDKINSWAAILSQWALNSTQSDLRALRLEAAMSRYAQVLDADNSTPTQKCRALISRGFRKEQLQEYVGAIEDATAALEMPDALPEQKGNALYNRGVSKGQLKDHDGAIADYTAVLEMPDAPPEQKAEALVNRGVAKGQLEDHQGEIADYTAVLEMPDAPPEQKAQALYNRGARKGQLEDHQGAIADYTAVLEMPDAPPEQKAEALYNRGVAKGQLEDHQGEIADYTAVLEMPDAPPEQKAQALYNRGVAKGQLEDHQGEIADCTAVLEMPDALPEQKAQALNNRGVAKGQLVDHQGAIADYTAVLEMPDAPPEQKAKALYNRGARKGQLEDHQGAIADYTAVLEMPDAPPEHKAKALSNRGWQQYEQSRFEEAIADYLEAIKLDSKRCNSHGNLAVVLLVSNRIEEALSAYEQALLLANLDNVSDMENDLNDALEKHGSIPATEQVRERIARRRAELQT